MSSAIIDSLTFGDEQCVPPGIEWRVSDGFVAYDTAVAVMEARATAIAAGTAGRAHLASSASPSLHRRHQRKACGLSSRRAFPVHASGRGGQLTYHGPGQRVVYVMLDLERRGADVRRFVAALEEWIIRTLAAFDIAGERRAGRIGVWVRRPEQRCGMRGQDRCHRRADQTLGDAARHRSQRRSAT